MCCVLIPLTEAIVVSVITRAIKARENRSEIPKEQVTQEKEYKIPLSRKMKWLSNLLWGGSALLTFEHVWHGELTPWFPFITAAGNPAQNATMFREMATAGVAMAALVTAIWAIILLVTAKMEKRQMHSIPAELLKTNL